MGAITTRTGNRQGAAEVDAGLCLPVLANVADVSPTVAAKWSKGTGGPAGDEVQNLVPTVSNTLGRRGTRSHTELDGHGAHVVEPLPFDTTQITSATNRSQPQPGDPCHPLAREHLVPALVAAPLAVRRLTPRECERLQGFPDDWTLITYRGKPASDGPRYKALGNSMAVNVMRWIGLRIAAVEGGTHEVR